MFLSLSLSLCLNFDYCYNIKKYILLYSKDLILDEVKVKITKRKRIFLNFKNRNFNLEINRFSLFFERILNSN